MEHRKNMELKKETESYGPESLEENKELLPSLNPRGQGYRGQGSSKDQK